jgi:hypothetical protein
MIQELHFSLENIMKPLSDNLSGQLEEQHCKLRDTNLDKKESN